LFNGVRVRSLRQAIGIPNINLDALSNFQQTNLSRPHANEQDDDHNDNE
jgi:hypothetical protein